MATSSGQYSWQNKPNRSASQKAAAAELAAADAARARKARSASETGAKIKAELDELLDEIDEVLEENAVQFVKDYVQKGGQ